MITVEINDRQARLAIDARRLAQAVEAVLAEEGVETATINVAIVDDPTIHDLNRRFLDHDEPTDVLSFLLDEESGQLEGDVIVSADTAATMAAQLQWPAADELLLYVVHGALHLAGYDDLDPHARAEMRRRERHYLAQFGLQSPSVDPENDVVKVFSAEPDVTALSAEPDLILSHEG